MSRRKQMGCVVVLLALVVGGAAFVHWLPREPLLLERATRILSTKGLYEGHRFNEGIRIHWLSDQDLLYCRFLGSTCTIYRYNVLTGQEKMLPGLTASYHTLGAEVIDCENVSPDGRWFACSARWDECLLAEVNGTKHFLYPSKDEDCYRHIFWMPDSRHWLERYSNGGTHRLILHDTQQSQKSIALPVGNNAKQFSEIKTLLSDHETLLVEQPERDIGDTEVSPTITVSKFMLNAKTKLTEPHTLTAPHGSGQYHFAISPQGDKIAWTVTTTRADAMRTWLHRWLPFVRATAVRRVEVWTSDINGKNLREIGYFPKPLAPDEDEGEEYIGLEWLPGEKKLSFEYNDTLYTVPAE